MGASSFKTTGPIEMEFEDRYAQFAHLHIGNHGVVHPRAA